MSPWPWKLLSDRPPGPGDPDEFGTASYTSAIATLARSAPLPFTLGVFGAWGEGKTTVVGSRLRTALSSPGSDSAIGYVYFDCWKYQGDSLRRQLIRESAEQLSTAGQLERSAAAALTRDFYEGTSAPRTTLRGVDWLSVGAFVIQVALIALVFAAADSGLKALGVRLPEGFWLPAAASLLAAALMLFANAIVAARIQQVTRSAVSEPEVFEERFRRILHTSTVDRVVLVVDNLDRTTDDRVLETLATIKTFLDSEDTNVVFVVACDPDAIRRVIEEVHGPDIPSDPADEFLRKVFNARVSLGSHLEADLREYVGGLVLESGLGARGDQIVDVIGAALRRSPRRIKQLVNIVVARMTVLASRTGLDAVPPVAEVAKVVALEEAWPDVSRTLLTRPQSLDRWTQEAIAIDVPEDPQSPVATTPAFANFLRATVHVRVADVLAILQDRRAETESGAMDAALFRDALSAGDVPGAMERLSDAPDVTAYGDLSAEELGRAVPYPNDFRQVATVVLTASLEHPAFEGAADEIVRLVARHPDLRIQLTLLPPTPFVAACLRTEAADGKTMLSHVLQQFREHNSPPPGWRVAVARALGVASRSRPAFATDLRNASAAPLTIQDPLAEGELLRIDPELVAREVFEYAVETLTADSLGDDDPYWIFLRDAGLNVPIAVQPSLWQKLAGIATPAADEAIVRTRAGAQSPATPASAEVAQAIRRAMAADVDLVTQGIEALAVDGLDEIASADATLFVATATARDWLQLAKGTAGAAAGRIFALAPTESYEKLRRWQSRELRALFAACWLSRVELSPLLSAAVAASDWRLVRSAIAAVPRGRAVGAHDALVALIEAILSRSTLAQAAEPLALLDVPGWRVEAPKVALPRIEALISGSLWDRGAWALAVALSPRLARTKQFRQAIVVAVAKELALAPGALGTINGAAAAWQAQYPQTQLARQLANTLRNVLRRPDAQISQVCETAVRAGRLGQANEQALLRDLQSAAAAARLAPADKAAIRALLQLYANRRKMRAHSSLKSMARG